MTGPVIPMVAFVIMCGFTFYYLFKTKHIERMARIEHGMTEAIPESNFLLNFGIFLVSLALGLFTSYITAQFYDWPDYIFIPGFLLLFGGLGLLLAHVLDKRKKA